VFGIIQALSDRIRLAQRFHSTYKSGTERLMSSEIEVVGARTNNLQSVDVVLPLRKATMLVGVSGSGKSSLLADTLATEANGRMRRFLGVHQPHLNDEDVPAFIGPVPACVHFSQGAFRASRRTTVATSSGLLALLRSYFRRYSKPWAEEVKDFVPPPSVDSYGGWIQKHYQGALSVWTVVERWERTDGVRAASLLLRHGLKRATVRSETDTAARSERGREVDLEHFRPLAANVKHLIEAEVGSTGVKDVDDELLPLLQKAFDIGGDVIVEFHQGKNLPEELYSERGILLDSTQHWVHPKVLLPFAPPSDALLSFNQPSNPRSGACPACQGLGRMRTVAISALVAKPDHSMHKGAFSLWTEKNYRYVNIQHETIEGLRGMRDFTPDVAWKRLSEDARDLILFGSGKEAVPDLDLKTGRKVSTPRPFPGFVPTILRRAEGNGAAARALEALTTEGPCPECKGTRWSREARALRLGQWNLPIFLGLIFDELEKFAAPRGELERGLPKEARSLAGSLQVSSEAFVAAGLGHLSGERGMTTLSEGESRRSRLAAILRARGQELALLLDEPARGLHEEDVARLAGALSDLKRRHTLIINEHRLSLASIADHVLEIGPGAGAQGGRIVNSGPPKSVFTPNWYPSIERLHLSTSTSDSWLKVEGAKIHNLKNVTCRIPLGRLVCITGVSGSGKSSFIRGILLPALAEALPKLVEAEGFIWPDGVWEGITGDKSIRSVLALEPRTPSAQRRSTVATILGLADDVRRIFGKSEEARKAGLKATDFGWNAGDGRCQTCLGLGEIEDGDRWVSCPHCGGRRFGEEALAVRVEGLNVADLLELSITELRNHPFAELAGWQPVTKQLVALDLGYLTLGRRVDRISGGEHQRLRVAKTLAGEKSEGLLLVLDEPSAGLHPHDVAQLLRVLDRVVAEGRNTVVLVEHNLDLIRASDWVIDFGPGGGPEGGKIVGQGSPDKIAKLDTPTGRVLANKKVRSISVHAKTQPRGATPKAIASEDAARSGRQWLKRLLGEETSAMAELDPVDFEGLAVMFDDTVATARPYEIGGLDVEIARLLLDEPDDVSEEPERLALLWAETPEAQLRIHPLLEELRVWGDKLPLSVLRAAERRLKHMGLESDLPLEKQSSQTAVRATSLRFHPVGGTLAERKRCIRDALGIGGGYLELFEDSRGIIATIQRRHLDLEIPAVAPLSPSSAFLVRSHTAGHCPGCTGEGKVTIFDEALVVAHPTAEPTDERFLHPEALKILRGVRKNVLLPFLKRMVVEGLWPEGRSFAELGPDERTILMHGYWHRPGPGSFLKTPKSDPEEVGSWLRWDGLFRAVLDELDRSTAKEWIKEIQSTTRSIICPVCGGTGLQQYSRAIRLGTKSLFKWVQEGTIKDLIKVIGKLVPVSARSKRMRKRILYCLEPLSRAPASNTKLREPVKDTKLLRAVFERTVHSLTRLEVLG
jgi:excinuclease ABC A subunit